MDSEVINNTNIKEFDFHYGNESEQYTFFKVPKILFTDEQFSVLSIEANNSNTSIATIPSKEPNNNTYGTHATSTNALKPDVKSLAEQHPDLNYVIGTVYSIERFATVSGQQISLGNYRGIDEEEFAIKSEFPDVLYYAHARIQIGVDNFTEITPFVPETVLKDIYSNLQPESAVNQHILEMTVVPSMSALFKVYNANDYTLPDNVQNTSVKEKPVETQNDLYRSNLTYPRMDDIHNYELSSDKIFIEVSQVIEEFDKLCENYMNTGDTEVFECLKENTTAYEQ